MVSIPGWSNGSKPPITVNAIAVSRVSTSSSAQTLGTGTAQSIARIFALATSAASPASSSSTLPNGGSGTARLTPTAAEDSGRKLTQLGSLHLIAQTQRLS